MFRGTEEFWKSYYWLVNSYIVIISLLIGFFGVKAVKEKEMICFVALSKILLTIYYIFCLIWVHDISTLEGHIVFWLAFILAGFMSIKYRKRYIYGN